jgi:hypothetical protein
LKDAPELKNSVVIYDINNMVEGFDAEFMYSFKMTTGSNEVILKLFYLIYLFIKTEFY